MSDETQKAMEDAILAHVQSFYDEPVFLADFAGYVKLDTMSGIDRGTNRFQPIYSDGCSHDVAAGLVHDHVLRLDFELIESWKA
jgi:hypothetical protein